MHHGKCGSKMIVTEGMSFWKNKKVLVTGHTGFKGTWLCELLNIHGADVYGYALEPPTDPSIFDIINTKERITSYKGDISDFDRLFGVFSDVKPEIVFHLAAQPLVRESYVNPRYTYQTNVMGTVNVLECMRQLPSVRSMVNITTDKVYDNMEWCWGYRETDRLDGFDPYSNSKSCSELVTHSYIRSFFKDIAISTVRAGNVIGGGDFAKDRIIPDCVRSAVSGEQIQIRNPYSVRPYQHVLEPLCAYMLIAEKQYVDTSFADSYNIGPDYTNCVTTGKIADTFCNLWSGAEWIDKSDVHAPHEAGFLKLDCSKIKQKLGWKPEWDIDQTMKKTVQWYKAYFDHEDMEKVTIRQIEEFKEVRMGNSMEYRADSEKEYAMV